mmetsp:Transcript_35314/g.54243  ORF Transcript_35314/g.54243 Transcript_35314/m.54243 type:complete len:203 (+) Transcript_35314:157-765(+)
MAFCLLPQQMFVLVSSYVELSSLSLLLLFLISSSSSSCLFSAMESMTPPPRTEATMGSATSVGILTPKYSAIIFAPMNPNTIATEGSRYLRSDAALERIVYSDRSPRIANMFDTRTIIGFSVTPNTAGILSTAKTMSLISNAIMQISKGVAFLTPLTSVKNRSPSYSSVESINRRLNRIIPLLLISSSSSSSSPPNSIFPEE